MFARINGATVGPFGAGGGGGSAFDAITAASGSSTNADLWGDLTTGNIKIGAGQTSGDLRLGNASQSGAVIVEPDRLYFGSANLKQMIFTGGPTHHCVELGRQDGTASTPYLDFHSGSTVVDYDTRLLASGGNGSAGGGKLTVESGEVAFTGTLTPMTGTTAKAPIDFTAGSLLTTPAGGAMEYDGKARYFTPNGSAVGGRAVDLTAHFYRLTSARALSNVSTDQSIFGVGCTLAANTTYLIEMEVLFTAASGGTAASVGLSFGGTAGISNIAYRAIAAHSVTSGATAASASNFVFVTTAANTLVVPSGTNWYKRISVHGVVSINGTSGTFIPQAKWSAAPGGAPSVAVNSFVKLTPIGSDTVNSIGAWA